MFTINRKRGFSLTEVLVAVVILFIGFVPVYLFLFSSEQSAVETIRTVEALGRVQTLIEEIATIPYARLSVTTGRIPVMEFKSSLSEEDALVITTSMEEEKMGYEKFVDIKEGKTGKIVLVTIHDTRRKGSDSGERDVELGTLVVPQ
jgi:prepilin-type N-terminal cleavage/methylation domain-containing protein